MMRSEIHPAFADWSGLPSSIVSDCLGRFNAMSSSIRALTPVGVVGPAHTLRSVVGDNRSVHLELTSVAPGSVLVIDAGGYADRAIWGGVLTIAARKQGILGVVIDGAVRDIDELTELEFPVFARGTSPAGPHKAGGGASAVPISCGNVPVSQGDLVIGDRDGVVVVPSALIDETLVLARARLELERQWIERINSGIPSAVVLGIDTAQ
ncbi:MAG TPA: hypothetical protein VIQ78_07470 [Terrimesophilobacter sp.]|uniref:RraA family protein n=1 Tax=Terrimesophilobacter sp. TaxID=2906435 RepID=UPI002F91FE70